MKPIREQDVLQWANSGPGKKQHAFLGKEPMISDSPPLCGTHAPKTGWKIPAKDDPVCGSCAYSMQFYIG